MYYLRGLLTSLISARWQVLDIHGSLLYQRHKQNSVNCNYFIINHLMISFFFGPWCNLHFKYLWFVINLCQTYIVGIYQNDLFFFHSKQLIMQSFLSAIDELFFSIWISIYTQGLSSLHSSFNSSFLFNFFFIQEQMFEGGCAFY